MSAVLSRILLALLIARAVAAPVALRPPVMHHTGTQGWSFALAVDVASAAVLPLQPQWTEATPSGGLVFRICAWPPLPHRHNSSELARRMGRPKFVARVALAVGSLHRSDSSHSPSPLPLELAIDRYLHRSLDHPRC